MFAIKRSINLTNTHCSVTRTLKYNKLKLKFTMGRRIKIPPQTQTKLKLIRSNICSGARIAVSIVRTKQVSAQSVLSNNVIIPVWYVKLYFFGMQ